MMRLGLAGYPVVFSLSPRLHMAALKAAGLDGEYLLYPVPPADRPGLSALLERVRVGELRGLNVTVPHKQNVLPLLDELTPAAQRIGAVNTILMKDGKLNGNNTDAAGFLADFDEFSRSLSEAPRRALVLGAGGAARAVVYALRGAGLEVIVAARDAAQAAALTRALGRDADGDQPVPIALNRAEMEPVLDRPVMIVNATSAGMAPKTDWSPWPEGLAFPHGSAVYDLVYDPRETRLMRQASAAGVCARGGLGMLVEQAALAFEIWTGRPASRAAMYSAVEE